MTRWDRETDLLVVGSGGGGMTAALVARKTGLDVLVLEKTAYFGGSTARSGGGLWIPANYLLARAGAADSMEKARAYLAHTVGDRTPRKKQEAYLLHAPQMVEWLRDHTHVRFQWMKGYTDYYPERPGGLAEGRGLEPLPFNGRKLGAEFAHLRPPMAKAPSGMALSSREYNLVGMLTSTWTGRATALMVGLRAVWHLLARVRYLTMGQALAARLRYSLLQAGIPLWLNTPFQELVVEGGRVAGVLAEWEGQRLAITAKRGVLLAAGGFPHNLEMRLRYHPQPTSTAWTAACNGGWVAAKAAITPPSEQPSAVMRGIVASPLAIRKDRLPSVTKSTGPVTATTAPEARASASAAPSASATESAPIALTLSTP